MAEDVEPGGQLQRGRQALGELVEQQPQIAPAPGRAGAGGRARAPSETRRPSARPRVRATPAARRRSRWRPCRCARCRGRAAAGAPRGCPGGTRGRVSRDPRRSARIGAPLANASETIAASCGCGRPGLGREGVEAEARGGLHRAVAVVVLEEQQPAPARHVERMLVQLRQHVDEARRVREQRNQREGRRERAGFRDSGRRTAGSVASFGLLAASVAGKSRRGPLADCSSCIARKVMLSVREKSAYLPKNAIIDVHAESRRPSPIGGRLTLRSVGPSAGAEPKAKPHGAGDAVSGPERWASPDIDR